MQIEQSHGNIGVFYLLRRYNNAILAHNFFRSILGADGGIAHDLIIIMKGFYEGETTLQVQKLVKRYKRTVLLHYETDVGFDIFTYFKVAEAYKYEKVIFFNSYSRVLSENWLRHYDTQMNMDSGIGVVGATASWESVGRAGQKNPHVRTNGFMIRNQTLLSLRRHRFIEKHETYDFESGSLNMTRQVSELGLKAVIVDRNGKAWHVDDWPRSLTFRSGLQENLLVADNWTDRFAMLKPKDRRRVLKETWGESGILGRQSELKRFYLEVAHKLSM